MSLFERSIYSSQFVMHTDLSKRKKFDELRKSVPKINIYICTCTYIYIYVRCHSLVEGV